MRFRDALLNVGIIFLSLLPIKKIYIIISPFLGYCLSQVCRSENISTKGVEGDGSGGIPHAMPDWGTYLQIPLPQIAYS
jgi:hypothetical protein